MARLTERSPLPGNAADIRARQEASDVPHHSGNGLSGRPCRALAAAAADWGAARRRGHGGRSRPVVTERPQPGDSAQGETEVAQRAAAVVAATYRAEVDIDRRDRTFSLSYADEPVMSCRPHRLGGLRHDPQCGRDGALGAGPARLAGGGAAGGRLPRLLPDRCDPLIPSQRLAISRRGAPSG